MWRLLTLRSETIPRSGLPSASLGAYPVPCAGTRTEGEGPWFSQKHRCARCPSDAVPYRKETHMITFQLSALPSERGREEVLRDGTCLQVRPIHPEDIELERRFMQSLSPTSRRFRFLEPMNAPSAALLKQMTAIDPSTDAAYVALLGAGDPDDATLVRYSVDLEASAGVGARSTPNAIWPSSPRQLPRAGCPVRLCARGATTSFNRSSM